MHKEEQRDVRSFRPIRKSKDLPFAEEEMLARNDWSALPGDFRTFDLTAI